MLTRAGNGDTEKQGEREKGGGGGVMWNLARFQGVCCLSSRGAAVGLPLSSRHPLCISVNENHLPWRAYTHEHCWLAHMIWRAHLWTLANAFSVRFGKEEALGPRGRGGRGL